jgi:protein-S-isoprenylcysteine O-methyltransferase Ste14
LERPDALMKTEAQSSETKKPPKKVLSSLVIVLALSLATWVAFELGGLHLDPPGTTVVVGVWFVVVFLAKFIWSQIRNKKSAG